MRLKWSPEHSGKMPSLTVSDLTYSYEPGRKVISGLSFAVENPSAVHLIGENGSGKTTTLMLLSGFYIPQKGSITLSLEGKKVASTDENYYKYVYYVGSRIQEDDQLSLVDYLRFVSVMRNVNLPIEEILEDVSMTNIFHRKVSQLSAGMRRRFLIRLAIALKPTLLLLDEPFSVMDKDWAEWLSKQLKEFIIKGGIVVMAHPDPVRIPDVENVVVELQ